MFPAFVEAEGAFPLSQKPAIGLCSQTVESSPTPYILYPHR